MTHRANDLTKQTVKNMARYLPKTHIAKYMGIDIKTLNKYYEDELRDSVKLKLQLVETAFDIAINDRNVTMLIFLLKTWVGMTEEQAKDMADTAVAEPMSITFDVAEPVSNINVKKGK